MKPDFTQVLLEDKWGFTIITAEEFMSTEYDSSQTLLPLHENIEIMFYNVYAEEQWFPAMYGSTDWNFMYNSNDYEIRGYSIK